MDDFMPDELYKEFLAIIDSGDEQKARDFLVTHLKEFPQETQDTIVMAFFEEALTQSAEDSAAISKFQKEGLEMVDVMEKMKMKLEDKGKMIELKKTI